MLLFPNSYEVNSGHLIIEGDSYNAIKWVNIPLITPWRLRGYFSVFENFKLKFQEWSTVHVLREGNYMYDGLANSGINRLVDLFIYCHNSFKVCP
ncbi:hypothetical protein PTKIN_Ptkin02bG0142000 [Pterospermum kingtungense]